MDLERLESKLRHRPFKPFRMVLTDGKEYDVRHPELVLLGKRSLVLGLAKKKTETVYDRAVDIDLLHIIRTEDLASSNGPH